MRFGFKALLVLLSIVMVTGIAKPYVFPRTETENKPTGYSAYYNPIYVKMSGYLQTCNLTFNNNVQFLYPLEQTLQGGSTVWTWMLEKSDYILLNFFPKNSTYGTPLLCGFRHYPKDYVNGHVNIQVQGKILLRRIRIPGVFDKSVYILFVETITLTK